ncbi:hypothetical protein SEUCBS139899_002455 [Sporothrix eucalyptigena]|uniref:BZIP domain-containing protein n=1 Tax=Sporothrix eucalyptigena TaxID=1812306 RepID=A0ABP0BC45_9PEZI
MKYEYHAFEMRGLKTHEGHSHGKKRHGHGGEHDGSDARYAAMGYPPSHADGWSQEYYAQPASAPVPTRTKISALLNDDDGPDMPGGYYSTAPGESSSNHMSHSSHSHPHHAPTSNSFASVVLSEQRSTTSLNGAYTYHAHDAQIAHSKYASDDDYGRSKTKSEFGYDYPDQHAMQPEGSVESGSKSRKSKSKHSTSSRSRSDTKAKKSSSSSSKGHKGSSRSRHTPSTTVSSPAFSAPNTPITPSTPSQHPAYLVSISAGSIISSGNDDDDDGESEIYGRQFRGNSAGSRDTSTAPLGRPRGEGSAPALVQRERNRMAATKCRAKSKAAISKLEEDERAVTEEHNALFAQKVELVDEVLSLRMELIRHGHCVGDDNIQNYLNNAARMIGNSGGRNMIWGPDGSGVGGSISGESSSSRKGGKDKETR